MKKITVSILTTLLMLSMVFSSSVFAAEKEVSAWDSFLGLFSAKTAATTAVGVEYRGHIQNVGNYPLDGSWIQGPTELGTEGQSLRLEGFWIRLTNKPADVNIEYEVHVQNVGWMDPVDNGDFAGTEGKSQQIEAIKIRLVDNEGNAVTDYTVNYRGHVQNIGDTAWYSNGQQLGTDGQYLRLEALEVEIVKNPADLAAYNAALAAVTQADYTAASWTAYQAVVNANVVDEDNLQSEVDAATAAITAAQANLVLVPKVTSVTAINAKQVQITFNKAVNTTTVISNTTTGAITSGAVSIARTVTDATYPNKNVVSTTPLFGTFSADGKTLTVTVDTTTALYFDGSYSATIANSVKDTTNTAFQAYSTVFTYADTTAPTVASVEYNTTTSNVTMTFSEPLTAVPTIVRLDGTPVSTTVAFKANTNYTVVEFAKPSTVEAGTTKSLYVAGATDFAANALVGFTGNVTFPSDETALAISSITQATSNTATIVFNKSLAAAVGTTELNAAFTEIVDGAAIATPFTYVIDTTTDPTRKTVTATYTPGVAAPTYFYGTAATKAVTFVVAKDSLSDVFGNKIADASKAVIFTKDLTGPKITSTTVTDGNLGIVLQADEVLAGAAGNAVTLEAVRLDGVAQAGFVAVLQADVNNNNKLTQILVTNAGGTELPAGTYTIRLAAGAIADVHTNNSLAISTNTVVGGTTVKLTADINAAGSGFAINHFTVTYSEAVTPATALSLANYTLDGKALPSTTDIYFDSTLTTTVVHLVLPTGSINIGQVGTGTAASLGVTGVQSTSGKTVVAKTGDVTVEDNTSAKISSISVMGNTIFVKFDESVAGTLSAAALDDFAIQVAGSDLDLGTAGTGGATPGAAGTAVATHVSGQADTIQIVITPATAGTDTSATYVASNWNSTKAIGVKYINDASSILTDLNLFDVANSTAYITNK